MNFLKSEMRICSFFKHIIKNVKIGNNQIGHFPDKTRRYLLLCGSGDSINQIKTTSKVHLNSKILFYRFSRNPNCTFISGQPLLSLANLFKKYLRQYMHRVILANLPKVQYNKVQYCTNIGTL